MSKKILKFAIVCSTLIMIFGNIMTVSAKEIPVVKEGVNMDTLQWEKLIETIVRLKNENPTKSEEEIMNMIPESIRERVFNSKGVIDIWNVLTDSEKRLVVRYPFAALKVNDAKNIATEQTERKFGNNGLGDRSDAFRHGIWNAEMTIMIGAEKAELFATAHEDKDTSGLESDGHTKEEHKNMDLHNNSLGRRIGQENPNLSETEMADYIYELIYQENSEFIWLNN